MITTFPDGRLPSKNWSEKPGAGQDDENWAQTIVRVLGNLFRSILSVIFISALALGVSALVGNQISKEAEMAKQAAFEKLEVIVGVRDDVLATEVAKLISDFKAWPADSLPDEREVLRQRIREAFRLPSQAALLCGPDSPLGVYVTNRTDKVLASATIVLTGRYKGTSENRLDYMDSRLKWNAYVPPGHATTRCFTLPKGTEGLVFTAEFDDDSLELLEPESWILEEATSWLIND